MAGLPENVTYREYVICPVLYVARPFWLAGLLEKRLVQSAHLRASTDEVMKLVASVSRRVRGWNVSHFTVGIAERTKAHAARCAPTLVISAMVGMGLTTWLTGRAAHMNSASVFIGLLFWSWIWGLWGLLLGIPILVIIKVVADHIEGLAPVAR